VINHFQYVELVKNYIDPHSLFLIPLVLVGSVMGGVASVVEAGAITAMVALFTGVVRLSNY
jgi:TRAP-type C4-dicarboxylate transport system permease large subunit